MYRAAHALSRAEGLHIADGFLAVVGAGYLAMGGVGQEGVRLGELGSDARLFLLNADALAARLPALSAREALPPQSSVGRRASWRWSCWEA